MKKPKQLSFPTNKTDRMSLNKTVISLSNNWIFTSFLLCEFLLSLQKQIRIFFYKEIPEHSQMVHVLHLKDEFNFCYPLPCRNPCHFNYYIFRLPIYHLFIYVLLNLQRTLVFSKIRLYKGGENEHYFLSLILKEIIKSFLFQY